MSFELEVVLRNAGDPAPLNKSVGCPDIEGFLLVVVHFPYESRTDAWKISVLNVHKQSQLLDVHCMNNGVQLGQKERRELTHPFTGRTLVCIIDTRRSHEKEWHHQYEVISVSEKSFRMKAIQLLVLRASQW